MADAKGYVSGNGDQRRTLLVIFLRGAADGLNLVVPVEDDGYYRARPRIGIAKKDAISLNGFFGLNPLLKGLKPAYSDGSLAIIHAAGSEDTTRSHFEAQDFMEHGGIAAGGWLGRFLRNRKGQAGGALSAIALSKTLPESLRGAPSVTVLESFEEFSLGARQESLATQLARLYSAESGALGSAARDTLDAMARLQELRTGKYTPSNGADYPKDEFGEALTRVARLVRARVGLEAATIDLGGWDSHFVQSTVIDPQLVSLSSGLAAFYQDMGREMENITVVTMTEFGRRVFENASLGTDHGLASAMFVMGGGVKGGRVIADWPGLDEAILEGPGDLPVRHNYRNILAPILARHGEASDLNVVFPDFKIEPIEIYS